jgi:hypothetical protein
VVVERVLVSDYPPKEILKRLDKIQNQIDRMEKKLDDHVDLIMNAYRPLMKPLDKLKEWMK